MGLGCSLAFLQTQGFAKTEPVYTETFSNVAVSGDPNVWKIVGGKLDLNYGREVGSRRGKNIRGHIRSANANLPKLLVK